MVTDCVAPSVPPEQNRADDGGDLVHVHQLGGRIDRRLGVALAVSNDQFQFPAKHPSGFIDLIDRVLFSFHYLGNERRDRARNRRKRSQFDILGLGRADQKYGCKQSGPGRQKISVH